MRASAPSARSSRIMNALLACSVASFASTHPATQSRVEVSAHVPGDEKSSEVSGRTPRRLPLGLTLQLPGMAPPDAREPGLTPFDATDVRALAAEAGRGNQPDSAEHDRLLQAASRGDQRAQQSLLNAHLDWIVSAAHERRDLGLAEGDLFQEGALGLMEAIRGFESAAGVDFE